MADLNSRRRRWRGPALGGHLQRWARFCFAGDGGQATRILLAANSRYGRSKSRFGCILCPGVEGEF
jgi:hypothetical protein